eukprot:NODE_870_length_3391_cov_0.839915.p5 type:complete len:139 gc:universal NODE_870_length_3391_cov_0.839915:1642-1226(-)
MFWRTSVATQSQNSFFYSVRLLFQKINIFFSQFFSDCVQIQSRIDFSFYMNDFVIIETSHHMKDTVYCFDIGQEIITKTCSFSCPFNQTSYINDCQICSYSRAWFVMRTKPVESLVRNTHSPFRWINCTKWIIFSGDA